MLRELTLSVDETLYNTLIPMVEEKNIGNLLAKFVQAQFSEHTYTQEELEAGYKAMAADEEYDREAMEWCNGLMNGIDDETR
jgi:ribosomal protein L12E/L44/L45/RPP1/RPP2